MLDPKIFEDLAARLSAIIAASPAADIENARALLSGFSANSIWSAARSLISRHKCCCVPVKKSKRWKRASTNWNARKQQNLVRQLDILF